MTDPRTIKTGVYGRFTAQRVSLKTGETGYSLTFDYDHREVRRICRISGAKWLAGSKVWFVPASSNDRLAAYLAIEVQ
jgi:hypothetical protein